jgi:micrococcal nuclease
LQDGFVPRPTRSLRVLRRLVAIVATVALALAATACGSERRGASNPSLGRGEAVVVRVVDGDTVRVRFPAGGGDESVRLLGIDTPETHGVGGLRECFGREASEHTASLLPPGEQVRLVRDVEARDRYGRLLAYVYRKRDGLFVNRALAADGYATTLTYVPNVAHRDELLAAVADARNANRGLWRRCGGPDVPI